MSISVGCTDRGHVYCLGIVCLDPDDETQDRPCECWCHDDAKALAHFAEQTGGRLCT